MSNKSELCPYKILGIPKKFTLEELRNQFKKKVIKMHPDMKSSEIASTSNFQILSTCYKILLKELELKETEKDFISLKKNSRVVSDDASKVNTRMKPDSFDIEEFNNIFSSARIKDPQEDGYDDWIENNKFKKNNGDLALYKEPIAKIGSTLNGYLLGVDKVTDFSGENSSDKNLNYMDYKLAYTTPTIQDNVNKIKTRNDFKSLEDLELARSKLRFEMDAIHIKDMVEDEQREKQMELARIENMKKRDKIIRENFDRNNARFLSLV
jgi:hypothetical protein